MRKILYLHAGAEMYGADKVLLELIRGLDKSKFEAHVILPNQGILVDELKKVGALVSVMDYPILRRKYFNIKGMLDYIFSYNKYSKKIAQYVEKHQINLVHNNTTAVLEGIYLKRKCKIPLIWHVHEIIVKPKIISAFINMLMGLFADKIITVSQAVAEHVLSSSFISNQKVKVIYNGVDNDVFFPRDASDIRKKFSISPEQSVIGMIGRVNAWKGQSDFLDAVTPLLKQDKNRVAFLAGSAFEGEEWRVKELEEKISSTGVSQQIHRIDYYSETADLYNMFDIFVLPSTNPDPLPTVVLEAMACGKPIVAYKHGGVCEMVADGKNGILAEIRNPQSLGRAILELLEDREKKSQFEKESLARQREHFSLSSYINNFSNLYE